MSDALFNKEDFDNIFGTPKVRISQTLWCATLYLKKWR